MSRVIYSPCLTVQEARLWIESWNWWRYLHGALPPFCFLCKGGSCSNSLSSPLREQSNHRGKETQNASLQALLWSALHQESMIPTLQCRNAASYLAQRAALTEPKELLSSWIPKPCQSRRTGGKGIKNGNMKGGSSPCPKRAELKS